MSRISTFRPGASSLAIAVVAVALLSQPGLAADQAEGANQGRSLVGTWELQVSPVDCATGVPVAPPFSSLQNYTASGTVMEEGSVVGPPPVFMRTSGQGVWKREGGQWKLHRDIFNSSNPLPE